MYTACFTVPGGACTQDYIFSGDTLMDVMDRFNDVQEIMRFPTLSFVAGLIGFRFCLIDIHDTYICKYSVWIFQWGSKVHHRFPVMHFLLAMHEHLFYHRAGGGHVL